MINFARIFLTLLFISYFLSGCAQKVRIKALNPAEVGEIADKKVIAVNEFYEDRFGLSGKIESAIASHRLDSKRYFTLVSRKDIDDILDEQELQSSELLDEKTATRVGRLIGAKALINGEITSSNVNKNRYYADRKKCEKYVKDKGCIKYKYFKELCITMKALVSVNINILDVETGSIIYGESISKEYNGDSCRNTLLSKSLALDSLNSAIASEFVYKLTPHYIYFDVTLIEDIQLDTITDSQEDIFKNALLFIKAGRMLKAQMILQSLLDELDGKSYVVAYAYGVVYEAQGKFNEAKKIYSMADKLTDKPVEEINLALVRIDRIIDKRDRAKEQIDAK